MRRDKSITPDYFDGLYAADRDPWAFETSDYERAKYARTIAALPDGRFANGLEVGCSIGVLTALLGPRCERLLAVDVSQAALDLAAERCRAQDNIRFGRCQLPNERPDGRFDLVMLSEVVYYWDSADLARMADYLRETTVPGGHLMLVHWTGETDYPKTADEAAGELRGLLGSSVEVVHAERHDEYRLDLWRHSG